MQKTPWTLNNNLLYDANGDLVRMTGITMPCGRVSQNDEAYSNLRLLAKAPDLLDIVEVLAKYPTKTEIDILVKRAQKLTSA